MDRSRDFDNDDDDDNHVDRFAAEMHYQREAAEAADERLFGGQRPRQQLAALRLALKRRLEKLATNKYQRRLAAVALKHLPIDIIVRIDRRRLRSTWLGRASLSRRLIVLARPPTTLRDLAVWLHEIAHIELKHRGHRQEKAPHSGWWNPRFEVEAEGSAQEIMRAHGLRIPRDSRNYMRNATESLLAQEKDKNKDDRTVS